MIFGETLRNTVELPQGPLSRAFHLAFLSYSALRAGPPRLPLQPSRGPGPEATEAAAAAASGYMPLGPGMDQGRAGTGRYAGSRPQHSKIGHEALWFNDWILTPLMIFITGRGAGAAGLCDDRALTSAPTRCPRRPATIHMLEVVWTAHADR